ncbi:MAG: DMT family transporter [Pseudomonadota bacterium]|nr:DMT family transporter [Pseudomonadota bacterium]
MGGREWAMLLALSLVWGGSFLFVGVAVRELPPLTIVVLRTGIGALALLVFCRMTGIAIPANRRLWTAFFVMGLFNNVIPFSLIVWGQTHIAAGLASILNATTPVFTVLVAHFLTIDEKMSWNRLAGVVLGLGGVAVMIGPAALSGLGAAVLAQFAILGAALAYAMAGIFGRRFSVMGISPVATATGQVVASTLLLAPLALAVEMPWTLALPSWQTLLSVLALALLSTSMAYILYFRILSSAGATNLSLVTLLVPVSAILLGALVLGERLEPRHFAGMAFIATGLIAIDGRVVRRLAPRPANAAGDPR